MDYFTVGPGREADIGESARITQEIFDTFDTVFSGIGYFRGTFSLQVNKGVKPYQAPSRHMTCTSQKQF